MTELPELPEIPGLVGGLPPEPGQLLQTMIPDRVIPVLLQRFASYVAKIEVKTGEYIKSDGTVLPPETLVAKLISNSVDSITGEFHEYYALFARDGDPECFMDIMEYPADSPHAGIIDCTISRSCGTSAEIYFDGVSKATFAKTEGAGPWTGMMSFRVYTPEA